MVTVSAPGKLMLMGEHAVVYGYPSLVTAVDQRLSVTIEETDNQKVTIIAPQVKDTRFVEEAIAVTIKNLHLKHHGLKISTNSTFSGVYGFGSSSAVTVATVYAVSELLKHHLNPRELFNLSFTTVMNVQGVGSGFDVASASYGGTLYYKKGGVALEPLDFLSPENDVRLVIGYSGIKSNTVDIVNQVKEKKTAHPQTIERIFEGITRLVEDGKKVIQSHDWERLGKLFDFNQDYLRDLGVSCPKLEDLITAAKAAGAYGAKLSGAGGGDCMIALVPNNNVNAVVEAITKNGGEVVDIASHAQGARIETTDDQGEMFIVVDTKDQVIGQKSRWECHHNKDLIHRTVGVLIYDKEGRILLQKRSLTKDTGAGLWGISSAGHVTYGQTADEAVHRELQEELGVDLPLTFYKKFIEKDGFETEMAYLYKAESNGPFSPNPKEVDRVEFFTPREIQFKSASGELKLSPGSKQTLEEVGIQL